MQYSHLFVVMILGRLRRFCVTGIPQSAIAAAAPDEEAAAASWHQRRVNKRRT